MYSVNATADLSGGCLQMWRLEGPPFFACVWNDNDFDPGLGLALSSCGTATAKLQTAAHHRPFAFVCPHFSDRPKDLQSTRKLGICRLWFSKPPC